MPCSIVTVAIFLICSDERRHSIRRPPSLPEHAELLIDLAVSSSAEPLSPRALFPSLAAVPIELESSASPAMSPPWPKLDPAMTLHRIMLLAAPGVRIAPQPAP